MTGNDIFSLALSHRLGPLLTAQFFGAFHDNLFKNAFVVLILYRAAGTGYADAAIIATLAAGIFILPFILLSSLAGELADKYPKDTLIRAIKFSEIPIAILGIVSILLPSIYLSYLTLFFLGTHSALFGPGRYAIMPEHLKKEELIAGNALINACIFIAILAGTVAGAALITRPNGVIMVGLLMLFCALCGIFASFFIPPCTARKPDNTLNFNPFLKTPYIVAGALHHRPDIRTSILGIGWFYFMGSMFLSQMPNYARGVLFVDETVLTAFLICFSLGIATGSLCNNWLLRGSIRTRYVPIAIAGITLFTIDLYFSSAYPFGNSIYLTDFLSFTDTWTGWRILFDIFMIAACGGLFEVPLNAILQHRSDEPRRASILAASAIINALFIIASSILAAAALANGRTIADLFLMFAAINGAVAILFLKNPFDRDLKI